MKSINGKNARIFCSNPERLDSDEGQYFLKLLLAFEVLRSGMVWLDSLDPKAGPGARAQYMVAYAACCGWTHEAIELVRLGMSMLNGQVFIKKDVLEIAPEFESLWKIIKNPNSIICKKLREVRNGHIFHFRDTDVSKVIDLVTKNPRLYPFAETSEDGSLKAMSHVWGFLALVSGISTADTKDSILTEVRPISEFLHVVLDFMSFLFMKLSVDFGFEFEPPTV